MLDFTLIIKIAAIGIVTMILNQLLEGNGKKQYAILIDMISVAMILLIVARQISELFNAIQTIFRF